MRRISVHLMNRSVRVHYMGFADGVVTWYLEGAGYSSLSDRDLAAIDRACKRDLAERRAEWREMSQARRA